MVSVYVLPPLKRERDCMILFKDICCGTGTIGIYLAKVSVYSPVSILLHLNSSPQHSCVSQVIGVEMVQQAVEDARENARINGARVFPFLKVSLAFLHPLFSQVWTMQCLSAEKLKTFFPASLSRKPLPLRRLA